MAVEEYDYVVIGGGSAGLTGAIMAGEMGATTLLVDRERLGGDCLHTGCVPSKALIASAKAVHATQHASDMGVIAGPVEVDFRKVMERVRLVQDQIGASETPEALAKHQVEVAFGGAVFLDANRIRVGTNREVRFRFALIATGSRAAAPPIPGLSSVTYLTNENLWQLDRLPDRLVIVGGGPIGVEMGQAFQRLGSQVTIFQRGDRLLGRADGEVSDLVLAALEEDGVVVRLNSKVAEVGQKQSRISVLADGTEEVFDQLLVAVGRVPNLEGLGLSNAGIEVHRRGIVTDDTLATTQRHIFSAGDCSGGPQFTHWAEYEARIATRNALFAGSDNRSLRIVPAVTFCDPEVAQVGFTLKEALAAGVEAHEHRVGFDHVDRAVCEGKSRGFAKVVVDAKQKIIGVHLVGARAGEALAEWVLAMEHGLGIRDVGSAIHAYPTFSRVNRRLADEQFFAHGISKWTKRLFGRF